MLVALSGLTEEVESPWCVESKVQGRCLEGFSVRAALGIQSSRFKLAKGK